MAIETYGNVVISTPTDKLTFGDIKEFVEYLTQLSIPDDHELLDGHLSYEYQSTNVELIQCGEHTGTSGNYTSDFVVLAHDCQIECG